MPVSRKLSARTKYPRKSYAKKRFVPKKMTTTFRNKVKRALLKTVEPKKVSFNHGATALYHNVVSVFHLNKSDTMCSQGTGDNQRVGDQINAVGYKLKILFGQKSDRENVTFKMWVVKVPKGSAYSYANWFDPVTNNTHLDDINEDFVKVVMKRQFKYNVAINDNDEFTFVKQFWIPYKKNIKFGPPNAAVTHSDPFDLYMMLAPYDAYGSLLTDNIAYIQFSQALHYKDP